LALLICAVFNRLRIAFGILFGFRGFIGFFLYSDEGGGPIFDVTGEIDGAQLEYLPEVIEAIKDELIVGEVRRTIGD